jgi:DNA-binding beta-propeller fold protein YncE
MGIAISPNGKTAYVVLDNNDTLTSIDLTQPNPGRGSGDPRRQRPAQRRDLADGTTAYVSNEAGRIATADFQGYSNGTPVVADVSDRRHGHRHHFRGQPVHVHGHQEHQPVCTRRAWPSGALSVGRQCLCDTISVINTTTNTVTQTINLGLPIWVSGRQAKAS